MAITGDSRSQFHVLAVDDSLIDRKLIERLLKTSSYQVTTVDSGSKALKFLGFQEDEQSNPDTPFGSPNNHQVKFRFSFGSLSNVRDSSSFLIFFHLF
ncbi:RESPONSE REGULATOR ARR8 putative-RELATED [Salix purpurea]|uniref:RESPONSE REGULATOR ARR8 putative-RELATED n=1 Tax=Salix purpurea TaxID=77065 RepID=A0A9Q0VWU9_SALPP|nr:RESPONSE REGULATOR ARR8 putative-RELATED [Salix purpurea]